MKQTMMDDDLWTAALKRAIKANRRDAHNRYLQIATVRADGSPAVRTVVFRELMDRPERIVMITDARSDKVHEIEGNSRGEICWYFTHTREQFRFTGRLALTGSNTDPHRTRIWASLSDAAKEQFFWPTPAASPVEALPTIAPDRFGVAPDSFLLLWLDVDRVDHLQLRGSPQRRRLSVRRQDGEWESKAVNP